MESNYLKVELCYHDMITKSYTHNKGLFSTCVDYVSEKVNSDIQEASIVVNESEAKILLTVKLTNHML